MKRNKVISWLIGLLILFLVAFIPFGLFSSKETHISKEHQGEVVVALDCKAGKLNDAFFSPSNAINLENEIKLTFKDQKLDKVFYSYNGVYRSDDAAEDDEAVLHAKYNIYMGGNNRGLEDLAPTYSIANSKLIMTLYADKYSRIDQVTSGFFFIDKDKIDEFEDYSIEDAKKYYGTKGFSCMIND